MSIVTPSECQESQGPILESQGRVEPALKAKIAVGLLTGGFDRPYVFGLAMALASKEVHLEVIGGDAVDRPELHAPPRLNFLNLRRNQPEKSFLRRVIRIVAYYARLIQYASTAKAKIFHILWNNKFQFFDRTVLMLYYKLLGKKIALTAHNINTRRRDSIDTPLNRLTLKVQYRLGDHIFVHTPKMKGELIQGFGIADEKITVIPFGVNNSVPNTELTPAEARSRLGIPEGCKTVLFFGRIAPYKGLEFLVSAFQLLSERSSDYRLIIAGEPKKGAEKYLDAILRTVCSGGAKDQVIAKIEHIPDEETEVYFKAADVVALPYTQIYQSGVLFLAYSFGLPAIATDVGSFKVDIIEGETGLLCNPNDSADLAQAIQRYFASNMYKHLDERRQHIRDFANEHHSWDLVGDLTREVYAALLGREPS